MKATHFLLFSVRFIRERQHCLCPDTQAQYVSKAHNAFGSSSVIAGVTCAEQQLALRDYEAMLHSSLTVSLRRPDSTRLREPFGNAGLDLKHEPDQP